MCGLSGAVGGDPAADLSAVRQMTARQCHRGPDSDAVQDVGGAVFGHNRLRIIDLSPLADQPMTNEDRTVWVVFNGEIYNFEELRTELSAAGHTFVSRTDTEVLVHLYEECGDALVERLRGMFAFALWDTRQQRLLLARDRLGIKPLYLHQEGRALRFASEATSLAGSRTGLDPAAVASLLRLGWVAGPATIFRSVRELPPGTTLVWQDGAVRSARYWEPPTRDAGDTGSVEELRASLSDAVGRHVVADVPVGVFLSSGLDSAAVGRLASACAPDVRAYTVAFDTGPDEAAAAGQLAARFGLPHSVVRVGGDDVLADIDRVIADMDQPSVDGVNSWVIARAIHEAGIVVALSGLGGDEVFRGYSTFSHVERIAAWGRRASVLPPALRQLPVAVGAALPRLAHGRVRRAAEGAAHGGLESAYAATRGLFSHAELRVLWPRYAEVAGRGDPTFIVRDSAAQHAVADLELRNYLPYQLLRDTDAMAMAHSVEVRVPLLDDVVVAAALALQRGTGGMRGKALLAAAAGPGLDDVLAAPKQTFTLPFARWLQGPLHGWARESVLSLRSSGLGLDGPALERLLKAHEHGRVGWRSVWCLAVLGRWSAAG